MKTFCIYFVLFCASLGSVCAKGQLENKVKALLHDEIVRNAELALLMEPITVTSFKAERSEGGIHDFYSEGDYWWPDPQNMNGPYIRRDGETNPDNFTEHRKTMIRMSQLVGDLTSAYLLNGDKKYISGAMKHIRAWFIDQSTLMNPNLLYAQAIKGIATGRGIGIIDTIHLIEVVQALILMEKYDVIDPVDLKITKLWFSDYLTWMSTHRYGIDEMNAKNNHGTCWVMQAAAFAKYTGNMQMLAFCKDRYKQILLPRQMDLDGSFPLELARTKPYGYSLFNLDAMTTICRLLSTPEDDLWEFTTTDGKNIQKGAAYLYPYVKDKSVWPLSPDIMFWEEWPVAHPFLFFSVLNEFNQEYFDTWTQLEHFPVNEEVVRNLPIRHPLLWIED